MSAAVATPTPTDYRAIYDHVIATNPGYGEPAGSPGYQACLMDAQRIRSVAGGGGRTLDVGCGLGFAVELLRGRAFGAESFGVDVSPVGVERGNARMKRSLGVEPLRVMEPGRVPHEPGSFALVTCFDVLEHLDEQDVVVLRDQLRRALRPGGLLICTAATRPASGLDQFGANLHRTVRDAVWWADLMEADEVCWNRRSQDATLYWRRPG